MSLIMRDGGYSTKERLPGVVLCSFLELPIDTYL